MIRFRCDRCLTPVDRPIEGIFKQAFPTDTDVFDIDAYVRETILVDLPLKVLCDDNCRGLCPTCGVNRNTTSCHCDNKTVNPKWDALKNFPFH